MSANGSSAQHRAVTADEVRVELQLEGLKSVVSGGFLAMGNALNEQTKLLTEIRDVMGDVAQNIRDLVEMLKHHPKGNP